MLQEFLWENTTVYRDILEQGEVKGEKKGLELGQAKATRSLIEAIVQARFPDLLASIKELVEQAHDLAKLQEIAILVSTTQSEEEVTQGLLAL